MPYPQMILLLGRKIAVDQNNRVVKARPVIVKRLQYQRGLRWWRLEAAQFHIKIVGGTGAHFLGLARQGGLPIFDVAPNGNSPVGRSPERYALFVLPAGVS